jgi:hypothetical protein
VIGVKARRTRECFTDDGHNREQRQRVGHADVPVNDAPDPMHAVTRHAQAAR